MKLPLSLLVAIFGIGVPFQLSDAQVPCGLFTPLATCLFQSLNAFLGLAGVKPFMDGTATTTQQAVPTPVQTIPVTSAQQNNFYMYFAGAAYCEASLPTLTCPWCSNITSAGYTFNILIQNPIANTRAYIATSSADETIVVSFRGSINAPNGLADIDATPVKVGSSIQLYSGFKIALDTIYTQVLGNLTALINTNPGYKVVVTGHSLGASMASLFLFNLQYNAIFPSTTMELYTYGQPRTGNKAYADYMNGLNIKMSRVVENADIAPHLVPAALGYYHHTNEYWVYNVTSYAAKNCDSTVYEDPTCSASRGPLYDPLDHVLYFDVNLAACVAEDPLPYVLQVVINVNAYLPAMITNLFPLFSH